MRCAIAINKQSFLLCCALFIGSNLQSQTPVALVLKRYVFHLLETDTAFLGLAHQAYNSVDQNGSWPDLNYTSTAADNNWDPRIHLQRTLAMAKAWAKPGTQYFQRRALLQKTRQSLKIWLHKRFVNDNWWHNEIGTPQLIRDIYILILPELTHEESALALEVIRQYRIRGNGANLLWSADLGFHYGALTGNDSLMRHCSQLIQQEIKISDAQGIRPDFSFHQHGARLQQFHYGASYLQVAIRMAWQLNNSPWAFADSCLNLLVTSVLNGWQWMVRGVYTVPGTLDRAVSRPNMLQAADLRPMLSYLTELTPDHSSQLAAFRMAQDAGLSSLVGFRHFPYSDFSAYHSPQFSFFLKSISTRTLATESLNGENRQGRYLNSGDAYLIRHGKEYTNLMPVWDWHQLPGTTSLKEEFRIQPDAYNGAAGNGISGIAAFKLTLFNDSQSVSVHKVWVMHQETIVTLCATDEVAGISTDSLYTTINQCRKKGPVLIDTQHQVGLNVNRELPSAKWIYHDQVLYLPDQHSKMVIDVGARQGSWSQVSKRGDTTALAEELFTLQIRHPATQNSFDYAVKICSSPDDAAHRAGKREWRILCNSKDVQAVKFDDGSVFLAFFSPGKVQLSPTENLQVNRPCIVIVEGRQLFFSDPYHTGGPVEIVFDHKIFHADLPRDGSTLNLNSKD